LSSLNLASLNEDEPPPISTNQVTQILTQAAVAVVDTSNQSSRRQSFDDNPVTDICGLQSFAAIPVVKQMPSLILMGVSPQPLDLATIATSVGIDINDTYS